MQRDRCQQRDGTASARKPRWTERVADSAPPLAAQPRRRRNGRPDGTDRPLMPVFFRDAEHHADLEAGPEPADAGGDGLRRYRKTQIRPLDELVDSGLLDQTVPCQQPREKYASQGLVVKAGRHEFNQQVHEARFKIRLVEVAGLLPLPAGAAAQAALDPLWCAHNFALRSERSPAARPWGTGAESEASASDETATPATVWLCSTPIASCRAECTAPWIVKPAGFTSCGELSRMRPPRSIFTSEDAVISRNGKP